MRAPIRASPARPRAYHLLSSLFACPRYREPPPPDLSPTDCSREPHAHSQSCRARQFRDRGAEPEQWQRSPPPAASALRACFRSVSARLMVWLGEMSHTGWNGHAWEEWQGAHEMEERVTDALWARSLDQSCTLRRVFAHACGPAQPGRLQGGTNEGGTGQALVSRQAYTPGRAEMHTGSSAASQSSAHSQREHVEHAGARQQVGGGAAQGGGILKAVYEVV